MFDSLNDVCGPHLVIERLRVDNQSGPRRNSMWSEFGGNWPLDSN